jgi:hypothetical protein
MNFVDFDPSQTSGARWPLMQRQDEANSITRSLPKRTSLRLIRLGDKAYQREPRSSR